MPAQRGLAAELVEERIKNRHISQPAAADLMGVSQPTLYKWEHGTSRPSPDNVPAVADFLHRSPEAVEEMLSGPEPDRITEVGEQLHVLIDELLRLVRDATGRA